MEMRVVRLFEMYMNSFRQKTRTIYSIIQFVQEVGMSAGLVLTLSFATLVDNLEKYHKSTEELAFERFH